MTRIEIPELRTDRLILRGFRATDFEPFAAMQARPAVMRYLGTGQPRSRTESWDGMARALGQWALRGMGLFALEHAESGRFVGRAGILHPENWPEPELAYAIDEPFWRQGLASEAAAAIRDWAFASFGLPHLASFILAENAGSLAVARRLGAVRTPDIQILGLTAQRWEHRRG